MSVVLRPYQERCIGEVRLALRGVKNVLLQAPTGAGKTIMAGYMLGAAADRGNDVWFICNRVELLDQTSKAFDKLGVRHSLIAPDYRPDYTARSQIASIDTLKGRIRRGLVRPPKMAVWDECRSIAAKGWASVHAWLAEAGAVQIGLDATPERHDGKPLTPFFQHLVHGPAYSELMELGNLLPFECYAPTVPDLSQVRMKGYDFDQAGAEEVMDKPKIIGDIVDTYLKYARGLRGITFAVSRRHSEHLAEAYRAAGVPAAHVDGDTDAHERRRIVKAFRRGELHQLTNVDLFTAGFDVPGVRCISDANPSESRPKTLQKWGRGSRPDEEDETKEFCYLFDHAGNLNRHGFPDDDRTWSLEGEPKKKSGKAKDDDGPSVGMRQCEDCFYVHKPLPACPKCGFVYPIQYRVVDEEAGELKKLSKDEMRALREQERAERTAAREAAAAEKAERRRQAKRARTLEELLEIQRRNGYQDGWAEAVWRTKAVARDRVAQRIAEQQFEAYRR